MYHGWTPPTPFEQECQDAGLAPRVVAAARNFGRDLLAEYYAALDRMADAHERDDWRSAYCHALYQVGAA